MLRNLARLLYRWIHDASALVHGLGGVGFQAPVPGQFDSRQIPFVARGPAQLIQMGRVVDPESQAVLAFVQQFRQRSAPGARTEHSDFHELDYLLGGPTRFSVPLSRRRMLALCL